jgi:hypothetical protein
MNLRHFENKAQQSYFAVHVEAWRLNATSNNRAAKTW